MPSTAPTVVAYTVNAQVAGKTVVPEKVTFAHWNNLASTEFDYEPDTVAPLDFTSIYNAEYMTADSAVALYYDMGAVDIGGAGSSVGLYYGVYSNHTVGDSAVGLNIINSDKLELNADKTDYLDANGERGGNFSMDVRLQNVSDKEIVSLAIAIMPGEFMYPYGADGPVENATPQEPYYVEIKNLQPGEIRDIRLDFEVDISTVTDYRRVRLSVYNSAYGVSFTDDYLLLTKDSYVFCPGSTSAELGFTGMVPQMTGESGRRFVYITGTNFNLLRDKSQYRVVLRPMNGGDDIVIDSSRLVVNPELNTATVVIDEELSIGTYQAIIDWNDAAISDIVSDSLRLDVLSAEELDALEKPYLNTSVTLKKLYRLVDEINALYEKKGYVVCRAGIGPHEERSRKPSGKEHARAPRRVFRLGPYRRRARRAHHRATTGESRKGHRASTSDHRQSLCAAAGEGAAGNCGSAADRSPPPESEAPAAVRHPEDAGRCGSERRPGRGERDCQGARG